MYIYGHVLMCVIKWTKGCFEYSLSSDDRMKRAYNSCRNIHESQFDPCFLTQTLVSVKRSGVILNWFYLTKHFDERMEVYILTLIRIKRQSLKHNVLLGRKLS